MSFPNISGVAEQWGGLASAFSKLPAAYGGLWNPALATAVTAGVVAPWMLKNDDRGYAKTSLVTTPLIAAGLAAAPGMWDGMRDAAQSTARVWNAQPFKPVWNGGGFDMSYKSLADLQVLREKGALSESEFRNLSGVAAMADRRREELKLSEMMTRKTNRPVEDVATMKESFGRLWSKQLTRMEEKGRLESFNYDMNAAFEEARLAAGMKPEAFSKIHGGSADARELLRDMQGFGSLSNEELFSKIGTTFDGLESNKAYNAYRALKRRVRLTHRHKIGAAVLPHQVEEQAAQLFKFADTADTHRLLQDAVGVESGTEMMANLRAAKAGNVVDDLNLVTLNGKAIGVQAGRRGEGSVMFGLVDRKTGRSFKGTAPRGGPNASPGLRQETAARLVRLNGDQYSHADTWLSKNLHQEFNLIRDEIDTHYLHSDISDDLWSVENMPDRAGSLMPEEVIKMRSMELAPSEFKIYGGKLWKDLEHEERLAQEASFSKVGAYYGNEHGMGEGIGQLREGMEALIPGLGGSERKNDPFLRSAMKSRRLDPSTIPEHLRSTYTNEAQKALFKSGMNDMSLNLGQLTPQQVAFFGALPEDVAGLKDPAFQTRAVDMLKEDLRAYGNVSERDLDNLAKERWQALRKRFERNPLNLHAARKMGGLGETQFLLHSDFSKAVMSEAAVTRVRDVRLGVKPGMRFSHQDVIGFDESGSVVKSPARGNILHSMRQENDGTWLIRYQREYAIDTGSKLDALGKGLVIMSGENEFQRNINTMNTLHGEKMFGSQVNALANSLYVNVKESSVLTTVGQANDVLQRLDSMADRVQAMTPDTATTVWANADHDLPVSVAAEAAQQGADGRMYQKVMHNGGESYVPADELRTTFSGGSAEAQQLRDLTAGYRDEFGKIGFNMGSTIEEKTVSKLEAMQAEAAGSRTKLQQLKSERLKKLNALAEDLMNKAGEAVRANKGAAEQDQIFRGYLAMRYRRPDYSLRAHSERFGLHIGQAFVWDTTHADVPHQVGMTYDMYTNLLRNGQHGTFREFLSEADGLHGDTRATFQWADHFFGRNTKPLGDKMFSIKGLDPNELFKGTNPSYAKNYTLDLGREMDFVFNGKAHSSRYLPVLGTDSYKGAANAYGAGEHSLTAYQNSLRELIGAADVNDAELFAKHSDEHAKLAARMVFGKSGLLRPRETHPNAMAMVIASRPGQRKLPTGAVDPFEIVVTRDQLHRLEDKQLRQALIKTEKDGGDVFARIFRHPVNSAPAVRVRMARKGDYLGSNMVGIDERLRSLINSDDDRDTLNIVYLRGKEAIEEAKKDLTAGSAQWERHRMVELMQGLNEDSRMVGGSRAGSLNKEYFAGSIGKQLEELADLQAKGTWTAVTPRLAHAETGLYSNLLTRLHMNLEQHPTMRTSADRDFMEDLFFQIRQVPISASKNKQGFGEGDPRRLWEQFQSALGDGDRAAGSERARDALEQILVGTGKKTILNDAREVADAERIFGLTGLETKTEYNLGAKSLREGRGASAIKDFVMNRSAQTDDLLEAFTKKKIKVKEAISALENMGHGGLLEFQRTGRAADEAASITGASLNILKDAARGITSGGKSALPVLGVGLGVAAAAGYLGTSISGNKHRPEETAGVADAPPGQPVEGSHSNRPRVAMTAAPAQTKTAVVSPMAKNNDIEVQASAPNRSMAAEAAKMASKLATRGVSNTTVNYLGGARERMSKLRMQQELREKLELNDY
jgi:hypothetical protein